MVRFNRILASTVGIGGILALSIGTGTLHAQAAVTTTTTTLTSPSNPVAAGPVTLTATIVPASGNTVPAGGVQFMDGTILVGASQPVTAGSADQAKTATISDTFTKAGSGRHSLTANFTPTVPGTASSMGALSQDVMGTNASFVSAAYTTMVGNAGDTAGINYWIDQITNHAVPRTTFAMALASSDAYRKLVISGNGQSGSDFYNLYLHRAFDPDGATYWVGQMAGGMTFEQVRLRFAGSPEFFNSTGPGMPAGAKPAAIELLYNDLLGRGSENATVRQYWLDHFNATTIAAQFLFSPEGRTVLVNNVYNQILKHGADSTGLSFWTNLLLTGASDENIIGSILGSDEYFSSH